MRKRYRNMDEVTMVRGFSDLRKWQKERAAKKKDLSYVVPQAERAISKMLDAAKRGPAITWVGHATFVIHLNGQTIVTDPVWANYMGVQKRLAPPGIPIQAMPQVDTVLLSHSHYDHLHITTLRKLSGERRLLVPAGLKGMLQRKRFSHVQEFTWWEETNISGLHFTFVPAQHWTRRKLWDTNASHWGGWVIHPANDASPVVYFAGDSGYFRGFGEIGQRFKPEYVLMPIGAYEPEWFMSAQHVTPEEAVQAFLDTGGTYFVPMHYGAFRLADDTPKEALDRLQAEWSRRNLEPERLKLLKHGETLKLE